MPEVMNTFSPFTTYSSPSRRAVVRSAATSEPPPGSVIASAAMRSPASTGGITSRFRPSLPSASTGGKPMLCDSRLASTPPEAPWRHSATHSGRRSAWGAGVPPNSSG